MGQMSPHNGLFEKFVKLPEDGCFFLAVEYWNHVVLSVAVTLLAGLTGSYA
jgi:hypothetical protein